MSSATPAEAASAEATSPGAGPVVCLGPYIVDVLARPVIEIPAGQGGAAVEEIRVTAAGTGGGTAVDLAQLGVPTLAMGCVGDDELADLLLLLLERHHVDASLLRRASEHQTSATVLPIRPNGDRPALHCRGAYPTFRLTDGDREALTGCRLLHIGGPERFVHLDALVEAATLAKGAEATVTLDLLASNPEDNPEPVMALLPLVDLFCPNDEQLQRLTGEENLLDAAVQVRERGVSTIVVTCGADGAWVLDDDGWWPVPAFQTDVIDTTGCGDAVSAGIIDGLGRGLDTEGFVERGLAAAALVAERLGSDGSLTPDRVDAALLRPRLG